MAIKNYSDLNSLELDTLKETSLPTIRSSDRGLP